MIILSNGNWANIRQTAAATAIEYNAHKIRNAAAAATQNREVQKTVIIIQSIF